MIEEKLKIAFENHGGTLPLKIAEEKYAIQRDTLNKAYQRGDIDRYDRGVYISNEVLFPDEYFALQYIYPTGFFSHESAMSLYEYSTKIPNQYTMTMPKNYNPSLKSLERPLEFKTSIFDDDNFGVTTFETYHGNIIRLTDRERTIIDMITSDKYTSQTLKEMISDYLSDSERNIHRLKDYSSQLGVSEEINEWIGD
jgi:predicted transcriptional regulator of viral defense system